MKTKTNKKRKPQTVTEIQRGLIDIHYANPLCAGWMDCPCYLARAIRHLNEYLHLYDPKMTGKV